MAALLRLAVIPALFSFAQLRESFLYPDFSTCVNEACAKEFATCMTNLSCSGLALEMIASPDKLSENVDAVAAAYNKSVGLQDLTGCFCCGCVPNVPSTGDIIQFSVEKICNITNFPCPAPAPRENEKNHAGLYSGIAAGSVALFAAIIFAAAIRKKRRESSRAAEPELTLGSFTEAIQLTTLTKKSSSSIEWWAVDWAAVEIVRRIGMFLFFFYIAPSFRTHIFLNRSLRLRRLYLLSQLRRAARRPQGANVCQAVRGFAEPPNRAAQCIQDAPSKHRAAFRFYMRREH